MVGNVGHLLLLLISRDAQSAADLAHASSGQDPTDTIRQLRHLVDQGFLVAADEHGTTVYRLRPKDWSSIASGLPPHILLIDDDPSLRELVVTVLEDEGYAVIACATRRQATALLQRVSFDLVITDGFSARAGAVLVNTADVVLAAGVTPVALFSAHTFDLDVALAAGFRDLITKPFDIDGLLHQVKVLVGHERGDEISDPPHAALASHLAVGVA